jgi:hypothetical protein
MKGVQGPFNETRKAERLTKRYVVCFDVVDMSVYTARFDVFIMDYED